MYLLREDAGASLVEIGRLLGGRDHSTVLHGVGKISRELERRTQPSASRSRRCGRWSPDNNGRGHFDRQSVDNCGVGVETGPNWG